MYFNNNIPYYSQNMYTTENLDRRPMPIRPPMEPNNRPIGFGGGGFLLPFALGFATSPLILGNNRPRPFYGPGPYYGPMPPRPGYYPYY